MKNNGENANVILGYIKAYQGQFREAACYFQKGGQEQKALEMFTELRMFDQAEVSSWFYVKLLLFVFIRRITKAS